MTSPLTVMSSTLILIALLESIFSVHYPTARVTLLELLGNCRKGCFIKRSLDIYEYPMIFRFCQPLGEGPNQWTYPEYMHADLSEVGCEPAPHLLYTARKASPLFLRRTM